MIEYFKIEELVSPAVLNKYGEDMSWSFFDQKLLINLEWIRRELDRPITVNTWHVGGRFSQRGLRENTSQIVYDKTVRNKTYLSAHVLGKGVDLDVKGMTAQEVRSWLVSNRHRVPYPFRLEEGVDWVHLDVMTYKFKTFKP